MRSHCAQLKVVCLSLALGLVILAGCGKQESAPDNATVKPKEAAKTVQKEAPAKAAEVAEEVQEEAAAPEAKPEKPAPEEAVPGRTQTDAALKLKLAAADMFDGLPDKIISKCPGCALGMDGHAEHAAELNGYTLYFCSAPCKEEFSEDMVQAVLDLKLPEK